MMWSVSSESNLLKENLTENQRQQVFWIDKCTTVSTAIYKMVPGCISASGRKVPSDFDQLCNIIWKKTDWDRCHVVKWSQTHCQYSKIVMVPMFCFVLFSALFLSPLPGRCALWAPAPDPHLLLISNNPEPYIRQQRFTTDHWIAEQSASVTL